MSRVFSVIQVSKNQSVKDSRRDVIDYLWSKPALRKKVAGTKGFDFPIFEFGSRAAPTVFVRSR